MTTGSLTHDTPGAKATIVPKIVYPANASETKYVIPMTRRKDIPRSDKQRRPGPVVYKA